MRWLLLCGVALGLSGCMGGGKPASSYYEACDGGSFTAMVDCGKRARAVGCAEARSCSTNGDTYAAYADALAAQVRAREITDAQARVKLVEFRSKLVSDQRTADYHQAAVAAATAPVTCNRIGNTTTCY
jgi:hypothetical protein